MDHVIEDMINWLEIYKQSIINELVMRGCEIEDAYEGEDFKAIVKATQVLTKQDHRYRSYHLSDIKKEITNEVVDRISLKCD